MITPSWMTNGEGEEVYIDKGAVKTPQINPEVDARYSAGKAEAMKNDYVEWPTAIHGLEY